MCAKDRVGGVHSRKVEIMNSTYWLGIGSALSIIALAACGQSEPIADGATRLKHIVRSNLRGDQLFDLYHRRIEHLSDLELEQEFADAGFRREATGARCWNWTYPPSQPASPDAIHAMARVCKGKDGLEFLRTGIRRGPWTRPA